MIDPTWTATLDWFETAMRNVDGFLLPPSAAYEILVPDLFGHQFRLYRRSRRIIVVQVNEPTGVIADFAEVLDDHQAKQQVLTWIVDYWHPMTARLDENDNVIEAIDPPEIEPAALYALA